MPSKLRFSFYIRGSDPTQRKNLHFLKWRLLIGPTRPMRTKWRFPPLAWIRSGDIKENFAPKSEPKSSTRKFLPALPTLKYKNHVWPWKRRQGEGKGKEPIQPRGTSIPRRSRPQIPPQGKLRRESGCWCPRLLGCRPRVPHC